ncbi:MAG: FAD-dependent monooxygenase [Planctomycetota bacterium]|nr:FAD-dependent monooxygenase [Planctomycetota bacterium]
MKIACIGGGPGGLYFSILIKKAFPAAEVVIHERQARGETFGWGVVFSDETMAGFREDDPQVVDAITDAFAYWSDIDTFRGGIGADEVDHVRSSGHGFCGMSRIKLLGILEARATELGVTIHHGSEITDPTQLAGFDLILASDGINSATREHLVEHFEPTLDWRPNRFCWLGTDRPLEAFTFVFKENEHGLFCVHAYPYQPGTSTWIVECQPDTFAAAGFADMGEDETVEYMQRLFERDLQVDGKQHSILGNKSIWRQFPTVSNKRWHHENIVLIGDAAHTAHFSIGSGTKLAMEDAAALATVFRDHAAAGGSIDASTVPGILAAYQESRDDIAGRLQTTAATSLKWFEIMDRFLPQDADTFSFNLMTRSKSITFANLAMRDPELVGRIRDGFAEDAFSSAGVEAWTTADGQAPPPSFTPLVVGGMTLTNRIVVSPMCQYSAVDGTPNDWHLVHLGGRAIGGAGLLMCEATAVSPEGRITPGCTGIYTDEHTAAWKRIVEFAHTHGAGKIGLQIGHAGRKASCSTPAEGDRPLTGAAAWQTVGPTDEPFDPEDEHWHAPRAMTAEDMQQATADFVAAAGRATEAGFDLLELHMAHGYLLSSFLSPASNKRTDEYGGSLENNLRFPLEVLAAVRAAWAGPLSVRISATDWIDEHGLTGADAVEISKAFEAAGADLIDVSTGGAVPRAKIRYGRMYQVPFAERIKQNVSIPVMAVGAIQNVDQADTILAAERADLCAMARPHLLHPYLTLDAAAEAGLVRPVPVQYQYGR